MGFHIPESEWQGIFEESLGYFRDLLRINTTNPPGNEREACEFLGTILKRDNLAFEILESAPGRANLVTRLQGDGVEPPILLNAHLDVVAVEESQWTHDPFGGEVDAGFVWGRGALDMKHMAIMSLMTMVLHARHKLPLKRDLIFAAVSDEEAGCRYGSRWLVENHPEKVRAGYALGEIGGFRRVVDGRHYYPIQIAEKGLCWLKITATGETGHGSLPTWDGAVARIGRAAHLLGTTPLPFHRTREAEVFVETLAKHQSFPKGWIFRKVLDARLSRVILEKVIPDKGTARALYAVLHNTANPTGLEAGEKINVVPSIATLEVDGRTLPGQTTERFLSELEAVIGPGYRFEIIEALPPVSGSPDDPILDAMGRALRVQDPEAIVVPYMAPGFTDAKYFSKLGARCFGFSPVTLPEGFQFAEMMHGHDERIPVEGFCFGVRALFDLVSSLSAA